MPCQFATDPDKCLREHNYRLWKVRYGDSIPCAYCEHARPNAEKAFVPEPGWGPNCIQCGAGKTEGFRGGPDTSTGLCQECAHRGRTNKGNRKNHSGKAFFGYKAMAHKIAEGGGKK